MWWLSYIQLHAAEYSCFQEGLILSQSNVLILLKTQVYIWGAMIRTDVSTFIRGNTLLGLVVLLLLAGRITPAFGQSLRGSSKSLDLQNRVAQEHDFTYIDTPERVAYFASQGWLVRVRANGDSQLHGVSFPFARPEVALFIKRLSRQYRMACGEQLIITSLTRPTTRQPRNASDRSVHPTGMALDLRYSRNRSCRIWLERELTDLEQARVREATRARAPPHYHVAIFPNQYGAYVEMLQRRTASPTEDISYKVKSGDSLWTIARRHQTTVDEIKQANGLQGSRIYAGQILEVPVNH